MGPSQAKQAVRKLLERDIGSLDPSFRDEFKARRITPSLARELGRVGLTVGPEASVSALDPYCWEVCQRDGHFLIRDRGTRLQVALEVYPVVEHLLRRIADGLRSLPTRAHRTLVLERATIAKRLDQRTRPLRVNLGAGAWHVPGWRVLDHGGDWYRFPRRFLDFDCDLVADDRLPFETATVDVFYSEHVFEHLSDACCSRIFAEIARSLVPGGGLRIVVPDAELICDRYEAEDSNFFRRWMERDNASLTEAFLTLVAHPREPLDEVVIRRQFLVTPRAKFLDEICGRLRYDPSRAGEHINWFDFAKLERMLRAAGFARVEASLPQGSAIGSIRGRGFDTRAWYSIHVDAFTAQRQNRTPLRTRHHDDS